MTYTQRLKERKSHTHTDIHKYRQTDIQTHRNTGRQTNNHTNRETHHHRQSLSEYHRLTSNTAVQSKLSECSMRRRARTSRAGSATVTLLGKADMRQDLRTCNRFRLTLSTGKRGMHAKGEDTGLSKNAFKNNSSTSSLRTRAC